MDTLEVLLEPKLIFANSQHRMNPAADLLHIFCVRKLGGFFIKKKSSLDLCIGGANFNS